MEKDTERRAEEDYQRSQFKRMANVGKSHPTSMRYFKESDSSTVRHSLTKLPKRDSVERQTSDI
jgi:hypothetical protein